MDKLVENIDVVDEKRTGVPRNVVVIVVSAILLILICVLIYGCVAGSGGTSVYVQQVSDIEDYSASISRFAGVVKSPEKESVKYDSSMTIKEIMVEEGDEVKAGDILFIYDTEKTALDLEQLQLEISALRDSVNNANTSITQLRRERQSAETSADRMSYDAQIQVLQAEVNTGNYDIKTKQTEISRLQNKIRNAAVRAASDGIVKKINNVNNSGDSGISGSDEIISILTNGSLAVEGEVNEQNMYEISQDMRVIIRSRADSSMMWRGFISGINTGDAEDQGNSSQGYDMTAVSGSSSENSASFHSSAKYRFNVALDSSKGLIIGQHVTIEPDYGQSDKKDGIWLNKEWFAEYSIKDAETAENEPSADNSGKEDTAGGSAYIWMEGENGRLKKQYIELGEYDEDLDEYEILTGLSETDRIAWPDETCREGAVCI